MQWDIDALQAVGQAPALLRKMVKKRVEAYVVKSGRELVTLADVEQARSRSQRPTASGADEYGGLTPEEIEAIAARTKTAVVSKSRFYEVKACGGAFGCPRTLYDVTAIAEKIIKRIEASGLPDIVASRVTGPILRHHKFNAAISGCVNSCSQPQIHDFGLQGRAYVNITEEPCIDCMACVKICQENAITVKASQVKIDRQLCINCGDCAVVCPTKTLAHESVGFTVLMGGKLGRHPQIAPVMLDFADEDAVFHALDTAIDIFLNRMKPKERLAEALMRIGVDSIKLEIKNC